MDRIAKELNDSEVIALICSANEQSNNLALEALYRQHFRIVEKFILRNSGTKDDAKDIFQESLIHFYKKIKSGDLELSCQIKTYIYSVCRNKWLDILRREKNHSKIIDREFGYSVAHVDPHAGIDTKEKKMVIEKVLGRIGRQCKEILYYFYYERYSMKEIAEKMGFKGEQSAKNKKLKCLKYLRKYIADHYEYENALR